MEFENIDGTQIPRLGFGTFTIEGADCEEAVEDAIRIGYRHIDTARMYKNEAETGRAIKRSGINRRELFITTKLWLDELHPDKVTEALKASLQDLQTDYVDLLLIHWPTGEIPVAETLGAMQREQENGLIRHLGISNFTTYYLQKVKESGIRTITNQVEYHALLDQTPVKNKLGEMDMTLSAYSPLARGKLIDHPVLNEIGEKYGKNTAQVALRWLLDQDRTWVLPKSNNSERRRTNFEVFDFSLDEEDHRKIAGLEKNRRVINPGNIAPEWD